jgi:AraC-like DNA-binding protein
MRAENTWTFDTEALPQAARSDAWVKTLRRLGLPLNGGLPDPKAKGSVIAASSPLGFEFALIEADPMVIAGRESASEWGAWLSLTIEGRGILETAGLRASCSTGMILYGAANIQASLEFREPFKQLFVKIPTVAIETRLIRPLGDKVGLFPGHSPLEVIFHDMLRGVASVIGDMDTHHFRPVELAVSEYLSCCLVEAYGDEKRSDSEIRMTTHFHHVCQCVEAFLSDPKLTSACVAREQGFSKRYVQRLFSMHGDNFSNYLKNRRLERCYYDLVSPLSSQLTISEICYRWGFSDTAHFSRSFRARYGTSARDHRRALLSDREIAD